MTNTIANTDSLAANVSDEARVDVLKAMDQTYNELVEYQSQLEQRNAELDEMRGFMSSVMASVSDVLIVVSRDGMIEQAAGSFAAQLGRDPATVTGQPLSAITGEEAYGTLNTALDQVITTRRPMRLEVELDTASGAEPFDVSLAPRLGERGKSVGAVLIGRPVGELRRAYSELEESHQALQEAQSHLVRNEKLASLGRLLAGVAHELNNPISFVYANTHALEKYVGRFVTYFEQVQAGASRDDLIALRKDLRLDRELSNMRMAIDGARDGAERVRDIVEDLRRLSSDGTGEMADFDLVETTRVATHWVARGTKKEAPIRTEAPLSLIAHGRNGHIQQVIMNLVQNALDAVENTAVPEVIIRIGEAEDMAFIEVADNGTGISDDIAQSIFDPFFTTKPVGKGTCEILGLDPLYLANEGTLVLFVPEEHADAALAAMQSVDTGKDARIIGRAKAGNPLVTMRTAFGGSRIVDMLVGEQLPRIC
ncbi:PAS domain-containing protein [Marivivens donghaensis]|uniref:histidine kinase n=1 Tax=Marivivens donghaensis TaxID=1699413 RepID=A0ABX0VTV0_9RHOB|nr:PAS domain-containing protein [Marivivens donghaensis]